MTQKKTLFSSIVFMFLKIRFQFLRKKDALQFQDIIDFERAGLSALCVGARRPADLPHAAGLLLLPLARRLGKPPAVEREPGGSGADGPKC